MISTKEEGIVQYVQPSEYRFTKRTENDSNYLLYSKSLIKFQ